eukprot:GHVP01030426.1.p1 GENE.GHVP01030426.1~~GHVP01030426.1.p1  ORF type:complete len:663 (+),score=148.67 GHVP01030426.1:2039-4027(+)
MSMVVDDDLDEDKPFRIFVATDNHIGYKERDGIRGDDSFLAFEEILFLARSLKSDFMIQGGDLFDLNKPSRNTIFRTTQMIMKYVMGDDDITFDCLNDDIIWPNKGVNFSDANQNIALPIFMIHGNHDDPGEESYLSAIDLLAASNLVNYFGKAHNFDKIVLTPIIVRKGSTTVCIYGLGNIRDERLHRTMQAGKVEFQAPEGVDQSSIFNLMMIHQNRYKGNALLGSKNSIHEQMLPKSLDLTIWGHEHECFIEPVESLSGGYRIIQPGSSVATSLSASEMGRKYVCVLEISGDSFRSTSIPLKTQRVSILEDICILESEISPNDTDGLWNHLTLKIEEMLESVPDYQKRMESDWKAEIATVEETFDIKIDWNNFKPASEEKPTKCLPLLRLRVGMSARTTKISNQRFGQQFIGRIANPDDLLIFRTVNPAEGVKTERGKGGGLPDLEIVETRNEGIQDFIFRYLGDGKELQMLSEPHFNQAVQEYVHKMDTSAIDRFVKLSVMEAKKSLKSKEDLNVEDSATIISALAELGDKKRMELLMDDDEKDCKENKNFQKKPIFDDKEDDSQMSSNDSMADVKRKRSSGSRSPKAKTKSKSRVSPKSKSKKPKETESSENSEEDFSQEIPQSKSKAKPKVRASAKQKSLKYSLLSTLSSKRSGNQ